MSLASHWRSRWRTPLLCLGVMSLATACLSAYSGVQAASEESEEREIKSGTLEREYRLFVPPGYDKAKPAPLIVALHGGLGTGKIMEEMSGLDQTAGPAGMIVAYPSGIGRGWNSGRCCGGPMEKKIDDVGFLRDLIADVKSRYAIDANRVYGVGFSNGAMLLHRVACEAPELFKAIAPVSGGIMVDNCAAKTGLAVMMVQGRADQRIPWSGGTFDDTYRPSIKEIVTSLRVRNRCSAEEEVVRDHGIVKCTTLKGCPSGHDVTWCGLDGVGHQWPGGKTILPRLLGKNTEEFKASAEVVKFFQAH
ncbi:MAG: alpha/beta hydrolase family esterase [Panacagrimonas sp.]